MYRYFITESAKADIAHELEYSIARWGKLHAKKYEQQLYQEFQRIAAYPFMFSPHPKLQEGECLVKFKGNYIIYVVHPSVQEVHIIAFPSIHQHIFH
jgi:plasmid stabilization system protein ParE